MLTHLQIRDFAIVESVELEFALGFTVLSGETGAGKSILVDALLLAVGGRADSMVVRHGAERAEVADFPNQVTNSLGFPGIFRGTLDVRARTITDEMCYAAAGALADHVGDRLGPDHILPDMSDWEVFPREAAAVAMKAQEQGLTRIKTTYEQELENAKRIIKRSRDLTQTMMDKGFIAEPPPDEGVHHIDNETIKSAF